MTRNPTENCGFLELVWFIAFNTESESENIINLLLVSQGIIKSKARSTALASAVKIDESSGYTLHITMVA